MRHLFILVLVLMFITGCSEEDVAERTNFAEIAVDGNKFSFNELEANVSKGDLNDGYAYVSCEFNFIDTRSNSVLNFFVFYYSTNASLVNIYKYNEYYQEYYRYGTLDWLHLQTYFERIPGTYTLKDQLLKVTIDRDKNGRLHGSLSGKLSCATCATVDELVEISGEFELPYSDQ